MTPHRHWFSSYRPLQALVHLADGQTIFPAGVGAVHFKPKGNHMPHPLLEFERVLHVPNLRSNLLSVLYLTQNKDYRVSIVGRKMFFNCHGTLLCNSHW